MSLKTYQWIKGDHAGTVVKSDATVLEENIEYIVFKDGSRCNTALLGDYLIEVMSDHPDDLILLNDLAHQPLQKAQPAPRSQPIIQSTPIAQTHDPLESLLNTAKKTKKKFAILIEAEVPNDELLKVVASSFESGEDRLRDYLINNISQEQIKKIKEQIANSVMTSVFSKRKNAKNEKLQDA
jgi:hypothetical protein